MNSRYNKFLVALVGAVGTVVVVTVEQNFNLVPRNLQPLVMFLYSLAVAFGVRQVRNTPPKGQHADPTVSEADYDPKHDAGYTKLQEQRRKWNDYGYVNAWFVVLIVLAVLGVLFILSRV